MIDWHSHILPGLDDGSRSVEESLTLLALLKAQGVTLAAATPHFSADRESVDAFLRRRQAALDILGQSLPQDAIAIAPGAEVAYYPGVSRLEGLTDLRISGTHLLLLEMPVFSWSEYMVRELTELARSGPITLALAHIERYWSLQSPNTWTRLYQSGILMQANAGFFLRLGTRRQALRMLKAGQIHLLGSDCHNTASRPPRLDQAARLISRRLGPGMLRELNDFGSDLILH